MAGRFSLGSQSIVDTISNPPPPPQDAAAAGDIGVPSIIENFDYDVERTINSATLNFHTETSQEDEISGSIGATLSLKTGEVTIVAHIEGPETTYDQQWVVTADQIDNLQDAIVTGATNLADYLSEHPIEFHDHVYDGSAIYDWLEQH